MRVFAIFIRQITRGVDRDQQTEKHHHKQNQRTHAINDQAKQRHTPHVDQRQRDGNFIGLIKRGDQRQHAQRGQRGEQNPPFGGPTLWRKRNDQCADKRQQ